ncbi:zf-HC2 domain-containing protein [Amycolatopsis sp. QT-25]|uniref:anti-sigma factor family protein n=1 Tax=Amycolatopsis sp. QT-25 TaxID=3034022 RepID=UPI0023EB606E|nr:zf-HC2 domain-containing protein [Amycolatopsis sp. QT-25]WET76762.1 zf-HC2 domain-containing protein [Amycolatopsis sp. QT-25]
MKPDDHRALRETLGAYALDQLDEHERLRIDAHLSGCADCRSKLRELGPVVLALGLVDMSHVGDHEQVTVPPDLGDAVVRRVRAGLPRRRWQPPRWVAAAVIAVVCGVGIGWVVHPDVPSPGPFEAVRVRSATTAIHASAGLVPHTWGVEIKLTATGFETGERYRVVIVDGNGAQTDAGEFIGTGAVEMHCNLNSSVLRSNAGGFRVLDPEGRAVAASDF